MSVRRTSSLVAVAREAREKDRTERDVATQGKRAVLSGANLVAGFLDLMGSLADGDELSEAFDKAYTRTKKRAKAIKEDE